MRYDDIPKQRERRAAWIRKNYPNFENEPHDKQVEIMKAANAYLRTDNR